MSIMKKTLTLILIAGLVSSCSLFRKKGAGSDDGTGSSESTIRSETTADGGSENIDSSPMNFSAEGSDSGSIDGLNTVFFEYDKASLTSDEKAKLQGNATWIKNNSRAKIMIEGHCDQRGSNEYNLSLGERRANAIKKMLTEMGVPASRLNTVSYGEEKPLVAGDSESAMAKNRRANFVPSN